MTELSEVEQPVIIYAKSKGFSHRKVKWIGHRGAPDNLFIDTEGRSGHFMIEFKAAGKKPEPHQLREIVKLRNGGFLIYVCDSLGMGKAIIDQRRQTDWARKCS